MKVWIGCLACYNDGRLIGQWYEAAEAGAVTTKALHAAAGIETDEAGYVAGEERYGPHEELWVMDTDEAPHRSLNREMSPMEAQQIGDLLADIERRIPESAVPAYFAYLDHVGHRADEDHVEDFEDAYAGTWGSEEDFAQDLAEELEAVPEEYSWPASYIDWERATRDLFMSDYFSVDAGSDGVYVFRNQ